MSACFAIFSLAFNNQFTYYQESQLILENSLLTGVSWDRLPEFFSLGNIQKYSYQPLVLFSWALENRLFGHNAFFFIFDNVILHLLNIALVFIFFLRLTKRMPITLIVSLLFAVHPMSTDAIVGIVGRQNVLSMFFYLIALTQYHVFVQKNNWQWFSYGIAMVMFLCAVLSRPETIVFVLTMFCVDYYVDEGLSWNRIREKIPFFLIALFGGWALWGKIQGSGVSIGFVDQIVLGCYAFLTHIWKAFLPINLSIFHPYPFKIQGILPSVYYVAFVGTVILLYGLLSTVRRSKETSFGILLFLCNLLPLCLIPMAGQVMKDSNGYLAYVGLFFLIAKGYERLMSDSLISKGILIKTFINCVLIGYMCWMVTLTQARCAVWRNDRTLWADVLKQYPYSSIAQLSMGDVWLRRWFYERAIEHYSLSITINPQNLNAYNNKGRALFLNGKFDEALQVFNESIALNDQFWRAYLNRALVYEKKGDIDRAIKDYFTVIKIVPQEPRSYINRGILFIQQERYDFALQDFATALALDPQNREVAMLAQKLKQELQRLGK